MQTGPGDGSLYDDVGVQRGSEDVGDRTSN